MAKSNNTGALAFVKDNIVVIGIVAVLAGSVGGVALSNLPKSQPVAHAVPMITSSAGLGHGSVIGAQGAASAGPAAGGTGSGSPQPVSAASGAASASTAGTAGNAAGTAGSSTGSQMPSPKPAVPQTTTTVGTTAQSVTLQNWEINAKGFAKAFANPSKGKAAWLASIKPYVTPSLYSSYEHIDIYKIPTETFERVIEDQHTGGRYKFHPLYASGQNQVSCLMLVQSDGTWLVDQVGAPGQ